MEILRTSEALETQILEDARRKAGRILEAVDKDLAALAAEGEARAAAEASRIRGECDAKILALRREMEAALPLENLRARLLFTERALREAMASYFESLGQDGLERVLRAMLRKPAALLAGAKLRVGFAGMEAAAARGIVEKAFPAAVIEELSERAGGARGLVLSTADGRALFRATLEDLEQILLEERRAQLAAALLGKDAEQT
jgi:V/A-type H+/Na+-transporting ATPase subunit E